VSKLRRAKPDVLLHTGYNPDITLFVRQAKEAGLKVGALIGHGAGYGQYDQLIEKLGPDVQFIFNVDSPASDLLDPKLLKVADAEKLIAEMGKRYTAETKIANMPVTVSIGFNNTWIFLTDVLPRAIKKYGGVDSEALRKAALETDIPDGGTLQGYGVKFNPPGDVMAGQNARAFPTVTQYVDKKVKVIFPVALKTAEPVLPLPASHSLGQ
jgi:branched-chain amino acid transport system substrate-binding protein